MDYKVIRFNDSFQYFNFQLQCTLEEEHPSWIKCAQGCQQTHGCTSEIWIS